MKISFGFIRSSLSMNDENRRLPDMSSIITDASRDFIVFSILKLTGKEIVVFAAYQS